MGRTYIPFYLDKRENCTLYYDYEANAFFKSSGAKKNSSASLFSGAIGVIVYALFKDAVMGIGTAHPLSVAGFSLLISCLLVLLATWGIRIAIKKHPDKIEYVPAPSPEELRVYIREGRKWLRTSLYIILLVLLFSLVNLLLLCLEPGSGLLFFTNTIAWLLVFLLVWGVRPFKRKAIYRNMNRELG